MVQRKRVLASFLEDMIWKHIRTRAGAFETPLLFSIFLLLWCSACNGGDASVVPTATSLPQNLISPSARENALVVPSPSMTTSSSPPIPTPSPHLCATGPAYSLDGSLLSLDQLYFDLRFNNVPSGLWPCVWRRVNDTGYSLIGVNNITIVPREGEDLRCGNYTPKPKDLIQVEVGDIVGFYVPENGFFMAVSPADPYYQLLWTGNGFTNFVNDSDLVNASSLPGRALLRAIIDTTAVLPSILPGINLDGALPIDLVSSLPTPTATAINPLRETTMQPHVIISTAITGCLVIVVFVMVVTCSLVCVIRKRRRSLDHPKVPDDSMEYNNLYGPGNASEVIVGGHRTVVSIKNNPAYGEVHQPDPRSALRRSLEHTYESLSSIAVFQVHKINRNNSH